MFFFQFVLINRFAFETSSSFNCLDITCSNDRCIVSLGAELFVCIVVGRTWQSVAVFQ